MFISHSGFFQVLFTFAKIICGGLCEVQYIFAGCLFLELWSSEHPEWKHVWRPSAPIMCVHLDFCISCKNHISLLCVLCNEPGSPLSFISQLHLTITVSEDVLSWFSLVLAPFSWDVAPSSPLTLVKHEKMSHSVAAGAHGAAQHNSRKISLGRQPWPTKENKKIK